MIGDRTQYHIPISEYHALRVNINEDSEAINKEEIEYIVNKYPFRPKKPSNLSNKTIRYMNNILKSKNHRKTTETNRETYKNACVVTLFTDVSSRIREARALPSMLTSPHFISFSNG